MKSLKAPVSRKPRPQGAVFIEGERQSRCGASTEGTPFKRAALLAARFGIGVEVARDLCENDRSATGLLDAIVRQISLGCRTALGSRVRMRSAFLVAPRIGIGDGVKADPFTALAFVGALFRLPS